MVGCRQHVGRLSMIYWCSKSFSVSAVSLLKRQLSCLLRRQLASARSSELFRRFPARAKLLWTGWYRVIRDAWFEEEKARDSCKEFNFSCDAWARVSKLPKLSGSISGAVISYLSQRRRRSQEWNFATKGQLSRISGSQFLKWLFAPRKFTGLSRKIRELLVLRTVIRESWVNFRENWESNSYSWSINCFYIST